MYKFHKSNWISRSLFLFAIGSFAAAGLLTTRTQAASESQSIEFPKSETQAVAQPEQQIDQPFHSLTQTETKNVNSTTTASVAKKITGLSLRIDAIGLNPALTTTSLDSARHLMVPANPSTAAWYRLGPKPGEAGTALITGHLDSAAGPGIFYKLRRLSTGDTIQVGRMDGRIATYTVQKLASYNQDNTFPWNQVYSTSGPSSLRIITCDGIYSPKTGHYSKNLVVYAALTSLD